MLPFGVFSKLCIIEGICGEAEPQRTDCSDEFNFMKGDSGSLKKI